LSDQAEFEVQECGQTDETGMVSICSLTVAGALFGLETRTVREVLGECGLQRIPLAPKYVAGVVSNRGEVLTTLSLRALLGLEEYGGRSVVMVLDGAGGEERFGLLVDTVGGVMRVSAAALETNPSTLSERTKALFDGVYRLSDGLLIRLTGTKLLPSKLRQSEIFS
jgi:purine-binding chemotaxis protein CheW